jgi:hypothetical protein
MNAHLTELMRQADDMMQRHPAQYPHHYLIWLSLHCLKTGMPWPGEIPYDGRPVEPTKPLTESDSYGLEARR